MANSDYVELREGGYYVAGTRVGLDVIVHDFRNGRTAEAIHDAYPSIRPLAKIYGAIAFILEHPREIENYLREQDRKYEEFRQANPLPNDMIERFEHGRHEVLEGSA